MTCEELDGLLALWSIEPWGEDRADRRLRSFLRNQAVLSGFEPPEDVMRYLPIHHRDGETDVDESAEDVRAALHRAET